MSRVSLSSVTQHCRERQERQYLPKPTEEMEAIRIPKWSAWEEAGERRLPVH